MESALEDINRVGAALDARNKRVLDQLSQELNEKLKRVDIRAQSPAERERLVNEMVARKLEELEKLDAENAVSSSPRKKN